MTVLEVDSISKSFGNFKAVKDLSFKLDKGLMLGLLGPNGAGKTTTLRMIMNIIAPDSGTIKLLDNDSRGDNVDKIGYLPEERGLYRKMKVNETLLFLTSLKSMDKKDAQKSIDYWFNRLEITGWKNKRLDELSKGMQQKVLFVATILHKPSLIIFDEPFMGFDPINVNLIKNIMLELKSEGTAIIFSTHMMEHAEKLCDEILLINQGENILCGKMQEVKKKFGKMNVHIEYDGSDRFLDAPDLIDKYDNYGQYVEIHLKDNSDAQELLKRAVEQVRVRKFELVEPSLNEIFIETVENMDKGKN